MPKILIAGTALIYDVITTNRKGVRLIVSAAVKKLIDDAAVGRGRPAFLGVGENYFIPSGSTLGEFYLVVKFERKGWACSCKGFRFSGREDGACQHIDKAKSIRKERTKRARKSNLQRRRVR